MEIHDERPEESCFTKKVPRSFTVRSQVLGGHMQDSVIVYTAAIISITLMEIVAMVYMHLDGVYLSAAVAAVSGLIIREYTKARCLNGSNESTRRPIDRRATPTSVRVGKSEHKLR